MSTVTQPPAPSPPESSVDYGTCITTTAAALGLRPVDVSLGMTCILGGLAGSCSGIQGEYGGAVHPSVNLLELPSSCEASAGKLRDMLVAPVRQYQAALRKQAREIPRSAVMAHVYGLSKYHEGRPKGMPESGVWDQEIARRQVAAELITQETRLPNPRQSPIEFGIKLDNTVRLPSPGVFVNPTLLLEGPLRSSLKASLAESLDRHALVFDPGGRLLRPSALRARTSGEDFDLLARLLWGCDLPFDPVHSDQGFGILEKAQLSLWSTLQVKHLTKLLELQDQSVAAMLLQCLITQPEHFSWNRTPQASERQQTAEIYWAAVTKILQSRTRSDGGPRSISLDSANLEDFVALHDGFLKWLDDFYQSSYALPATFHDLPWRFLWAFHHLRRKEEPWWCGAAAIAAAKAAVTDHVRLAEQTKVWAEERTAEEAATLIIRVVVTKGPATLRDIARSSSRQRQSFLQPGLDLLIKRGTLLLGEGGRYSLKPDGSQPASIGHQPARCGLSS